LGIRFPQDLAEMAYFLPQSLSGRRFMEEQVAMEDPLFSTLQQEL
jgi:hypothetical protein